MIFVAILAFIGFCAATYAAALSFDKGQEPIKRLEEELEGLAKKLLSARTNGENQMTSFFEGEIKNKREALQLEVSAMELVELLVWAVRIAAWICVFVVAIASLIKGIGNPTLAYVGLATVLVSFFCANFFAKRILEEKKIAQASGKTFYSRNPWLLRLTNAVMAVYSFYVFLTLIGVSF